MSLSISHAVVASESNLELSIDTHQICGAGPDLGVGGLCAPIDQK